MLLLRFFFCLNILFLLIPALPLCPVLRDRSFSLPQQGAVFHIAPTGMTSTASARAALPSPSMPSPSPSSLAASTASSANSYGNTVNTPPPSSTHAPPPPATCDDLDNKVAEFKRQWTSKGLGAGPDAMLHVQEYVTFLPRPWGFKERSSGSGRPSPNNDWTMPPTPPRTVSGYAAGYGPPLL